MKKILLVLLMAVSLVLLESSSQAVSNIKVLSQNYSISGSYETYQSGRSYWTDFSLSGSAPVRYSANRRTLAEASGSISKSNISVFSHVGASDGGAISGAQIEFLVLDGFLLDLSYYGHAYGVAVSDIYLYDVTTKTGVFSASYISCELEDWCDPGTVNIAVTPGHDYQLMATAKASEDGGHSGASINGVKVTIPEPSLLILLASGLVGLLAGRRMFNRKCVNFFKPDNL